MQLYQEIARKLSGKSSQSIAEAMGYSGHSAGSALVRIESIASSDTLGLDGSAYDQKYSGEEFVSELCDVLKIEQDFVLAELARISNRLSYERQCYPTWVFVETYFRRTTQPIFMLAALETQRRFKMDKSIYVLPLEDQLPLIMPILGEHYLTNSGALSFWGDIVEYKYVYADDRQLVLDTQGNFIDDTA
tara:strand:- start:38 stop:607 length:570 start_codon:yes stop_codon:yes gene_type:complete